MDERPLTEEEMRAIDGDPRREAGYYSGRARYFRLRAAQLRNRRQRGFNIGVEDTFTPETYERLAGVLDEWARIKATAPSPPLG